GGGTSEVERLPGDEVVQRVVVEGRNVGRHPPLLLETLTQLVLQNVAVSTVQEILHLLAFGNRHQI
ncbi:MAG: hypothetical protein ACK53Y_20175, partial [bacterium]